MNHGLTERPVSLDVRRCAVIRRDAGSTPGSVDGTPARQRDRHPQRR
jgi:hypothetical protein